MRVVNLVFHLVAAGSLRWSQVVREREVSLLNCHDVESVSSTAQAARVLARPTQLARPQGRLVEVLRRFVSSVKLVCLIAPEAKVSQFLEALAN